MHRYRIVAQISLIFSILNLALAAPVVVQEIHVARDDDSETVPAEGVTVMPKDSGEWEAASDRPTSPPSSPDAMASPQHSSSGYPTPRLSFESSKVDPNYSWLLERPELLSLKLPASTHEPDLSSSEPSEIRPTEGSQELAPPSPHLPALLHDSASPHPSNPGSPEIQLPASLALEEIPPSPPAVWQGLTRILRYPSSSESSEISEVPQSPDVQSTISYSPTTPSHHPTSPSFSGSTTSTDSMLEGVERSDRPLPAPTETPPDNAEFFNKNMMKKLKIAAGVLLVGGAIAGIVGSQIKHHKHRDFQDRDPGGPSSLPSSRQFDHRQEKRIC